MGFDTVTPKQDEKQDEGMLAKRARLLKDLMSGAFARGTDSPTPSPAPSRGGLESWQESPDQVFERTRRGR